MHANRYKNTSINAIFERTENDYSNEALLYQNILEYPHRVKKSSYKFSEMARWLIENNREFSNFYGWGYKSTKITKSYAVAKKRDRIFVKLQDLIQLRLVKAIGTVKADKVDAEVKIYQNTREGDLLALVFNREKNGYTEIHRLINRILGSDSTPVPKDSSSGDIFLQCFLNVCKEKNVLRPLIEFFVARLESQREIDLIDNSSRLLHELINLRWFKCETDSTLFRQFDKFSYFGIWIESYNKLNDVTKKLLLARYKSIFETPSKYPLSFKWELTKYDNASNERKTVLLAECSLCGNKHTIIQDTLDWLNNFFNGNLVTNEQCEYKKRDCQMKIIPFQGST